jgi:hypothetical protein
MVGQAFEPDWFVRLESLTYFPRADTSFSENVVSVSWISGTMEGYCAWESKAHGQHIASFGAPSSPSDT